ncbi:MAG TPA: sugar-binding transcriptional regulator [Cellulomonas sp.]
MRATVPDPAPASTPTLRPTLHPSEHARLMAKVARMYHERGLRQSEIGDELHISQARVSRLLKRAAEVGIVRVTVTIPGGLHTDLEDRLQDEYGLSDAVVVESDDPGDLRTLGAAAADLLDATLQGAETIGISSWSASLLAAVDALRPTNKPVASAVVQLVGGIGDPRVQVEATRLLTRLAGATGAAPIFLPAPGLLGSPAARQSLAADPAVLQVTTRWSALTTALVGIGALEPSPLLQQSGNGLTADDQDRLRAAGAVGDVCLRFFDEHGGPVASDLDDRIIGIAPDVFRAIPRRIAVAGGLRKVAALRGALRGGWLTVLVTDAGTARALLEDAEG